MAKENKKSRKHIEYFNPDVMSLEQSHQDFLSEINCFDAGHGYENFNDFISEEADEYKEAGDGVTYVVWNVQYDNYEKEIKREIVAYIHLLQQRYHMKIGFGLMMRKLKKWVGNLI